MKPFLHGKKLAQVTPLRSAAAQEGAAKGSLSAATALPKFAKVAGAAPPGSNSCAGGEANVEVFKEGDKVVRMVVTCRCGERIEIECLYPSMG
jgi:hypothetical protein